MMAFRLPDGRLRIPISGELDDGTLYDGAEEIGPDDPRYAEWEEWARPLPDDEDVDD